MGKSIIYDGVDLSTLGLQVLDYDIPEMASIASNTHAAIYGDSAFTTTNHETRTIALSVSISGTSQSDMQNNIDAVKGVIDPLLTDKVFTLDAVRDRRFVGRVVALSNPQSKGRWVRIFDITLACLAHLQGIDEVSESTAITTSPDTITTSAIVGNVSRTPISLYVRNGTGSQITSGTISVQNVTTSETIIWKGTLPDGYWLRFGNLQSNGTHKSDIKMSTISGADPTVLTYSNAEIGYQSGDWPRLKGGVANDITVTGISTGTLQTVYRARFL
jgi:predicted phage tail component-like protein